MPTSAQGGGGAARGGNVAGSGHGAPVLLIERVAYTYTEEPAELRRSWCDTREHSLP